MLKKTLLIDSSYFLYRSITTKVKLSHNELKTTMYFLLLNSIKSMVKELKPNKLILLWDSKHSYRKKIYPEYKRKKPIENKRISNQILEVKKEYSNVMKTMKNLGFACYRRVFYEADDLFAMYINQYPNEKIIIASRDEDLFQLLIDGRVTIYEPKNKKIITEKSFTKEYKITPKQWILYKMINGCESDNVKGIPGIGPVTTLKYLQEVATEKEKKKIGDNWGIAMINRNLVSLPFPILTFPLRETNTKLNMDTFSKFCQLLGFRSFLENLDDWKHLENL